VRHPFTITRPPRGCPLDVLECKRLVESRQLLVLAGALVVSLFVSDLGVHALYSCVGLSPRGNGVLVEELRPRSIRNGDKRPDQLVSEVVARQLRRHRIVSQNISRSTLDGAQDVTASKTATGAVAPVPEMFATTATE